MTETKPSTLEAAPTQPGFWQGFTPYRRERGKRVRATAFYLLGGLWLWGGISSYHFTGRWPAFRAPLVPFDVAGVAVNGSLVTGLAVVLLLVGGSYRLLNRPARADFLIETEAEMRRVSWPSWSSVWNASWVVVFCMALLILFMFLVDIGLESLITTGSSWLFGG